MQMKLFNENGDRFTAEAMAAAITIVTLYLQAIIYSFHMGRVLYFQISITAIPMPSFFVLLLPAFLIVVVIAVLYQRGKIGTGTLNLLGKGLIISMSFIPILIFSIIISNIIYDDVLNFRAPYYTNKIGFMQIDAFLAVILNACFPIFITFCIYILENFIFRRFRNRTALSITTIIILEALLMLFETQFHFFKNLHMPMICIMTVLMFVMWYMLGYISSRGVINDNKTRIYSKRDIAVLLMLIGLLPVIVGFAGYTYAGNLRTFKVFKRGSILMLLFMKTKMYIIACDVDIIILRLVTNGMLQNWKFCI